VGGPWPFSATAAPFKPAKRSKRSNHSPSSPSQSSNCDVSHPVTCTAPHPVTDQSQTGRGFRQHLVRPRNRQPQLVASLSDSFPSFSISKAPLITSLRFSALLCSVSALLPLSSLANHARTHARTHAHTPRPNLNQASKPASERTNEPANERASERNESRRSPRRLRPAAPRCTPSLAHTHACAPIRQCVGGFEQSVPPSRGFGPPHFSSPCLLPKLSLGNSTQTAETADSRDSRQQTATSAACYRYSSSSRKALENTGNTRNPFLVCAFKSRCKSPPSPFHHHPITTHHHPSISLARTTHHAPRTTRPDQPDLPPS
jgi:hypothetical protein